MLSDGRGDVCLASAMHSLNTFIDLNDDYIFWRVYIHHHKDVGRLFAAICSLGAGQLALYLSPIAEVGTKRCTIVRGLSTTLAQPPAQHRTSHYLPFRVPPYSRRNLQATHQIDTALHQQLLDHDAKG
jgi:hypothetical protein